MLNVPKVVIEDSHQDWIRIRRVETMATGEVLYDATIYEGHPGDVELDVLLPKLGVEAELREWERA